MNFYVDSEFGQLRDLLLGSIRNFTMNAPINSTQHHYYSISPPKIEKLVEQEKRLVEVLESYGVALHQLPQKETSFTQFFVRDIAVVIGNTVVVCAMKESIRQEETLALEQLFPSSTHQVLRVNTGFVEGGDILIDRSTLYVGLGERTNVAGLDFLRRSFGKSFEIVPLRLASTFLHLDVVFNIVGKGHALIYSPALERSSVELLAKRYTLIEVTDEEQFHLAVNVLSLSPDIVVSDLRNSRVNSMLTEKGYKVIELEFDEIGKMGGAFRCGTCPLRRD
jgi:N-dimethylarginine dimethylaminohydrolase